MPTDSLPLRVLRQLLLDDTSGPSHFSAASGMWIADDTLYAVADDELVLGVFSLQDDRPGQTLPLLAGALPAAAKARKAAKPDFESLTCLPACARHPHGALLALGSGSTRQRQRGVLWPCPGPQELSGTPQVFCLLPLYAPLAPHFADLNIEGAVVQGQVLKLWHRANKTHRTNAVIEYRLSDLHATLDGATSARALQPQRIDPYDLGDVAGVPLAFTDAFALDNGDCLFTAVAENTSDSYRDGECVAAVIGLIDRQRRLRWMRPVTPTFKLEGISAKVVGDQLRIRLVSDADDRSAPAQLLETHVPCSAMD